MKEEKFLILNQMFKAIKIKQKCMRVNTSTIILLGYILDFFFLHFN